ncbi:MAG TPA: saccharopine dehydrogenase NADP-binding domain-containing protein [Sediminibacterium sp.]|nr:saccharopine dehydrogenase NADP-binding domain-containing protein [Sediminibacterium sp.]
MQNHQFLLYGANGYTGRLIAKMAAAYNLTPVLAGRNEADLKQMAATMQLQYKVINLDQTYLLVEALKEHQLVLHAAGPFQHTARQMMNACIAAKAHYLDITGEISVFELAKSMDAAAREAGIMLMSGGGFDVVPTDCMALFLKNQLPDARFLKLVFATVGGKLSHGTAMTMAEGMGAGGAVRENGRIVKKPLGHKGIRVNFGAKDLFAMTIPWGDISTAYTTTGIPNIETYTVVSPKVFRWLKWQGLFNWLLRTAFARNYYRKKIKRKPAGPDDAARARARSMVWGEAENTKGQKATARLSGPEGYTLTAHSSLIIAAKIISGNFKPGYQTPAACYGADLVLEIPGVRRELL